MRITPEMIAAWSTLQDYALTVRQFANATMGERKVADAIDVLDNSNFLVPIEEARDEQPVMNEDRA
jgi:hypothetical protein